MADHWGRQAALAEWREKRARELEAVREMEYQERAAIMEFCGNMSRDEAEKMARAEVFGEG